MRKLIVPGLVATVIAAALAACGGGGSVAPPAPTPTPQPTAPTIPTGSAYSNTLVVSPLLPDPSSQTIGLASGGGISGTMTLPPSASSGISLYETATNVASGGGVPTLSLARAAKAIRRVKDVSASSLQFIGIYATGTLTLSATPSFAFTLPSSDIVSGANYYLALYDPTRPSLGWQFGFQGPGSISGDTITFSGSTLQFTFASRVTYWFALIAISSQGSQPTPAPSVAPTSVPTQSPQPYDPTSNMRLTFDDEFNGAVGAPVDNTKWTDDTGPWSDNNELEYYANVTNPNAPNFTTKYAQQDGQGHLVISAYAENPTGGTCWYGPCQYTSARLTTKGIFAQTYGRIEASVEIPPGKGLWPALWLNDLLNPTPRGAELDVLETIGNMTTAYGAAHGPGFDNGPVTVYYNLPAGDTLNGAFHTVAAEWQPNAIRYYFDGVLYATVTKSSIPAAGSWMFNDPLYLVLNLAVGGSWPGSPDASTPLPAQLRVDYVRVYQYKS